MASGFVHVVAVVDWCARRVLAWPVPIALNAGFCHEARARHGKPMVGTLPPGSPCLDDPSRRSRRGEWVLGQAFVAVAAIERAHEAVPLRAFDKLRRASRGSMQCHAHVVFEAAVVLAIGAPASYQIDAEHHAARIRIRCFYAAEQSGRFAVEPSFVCHPICLTAASEIDGIPCGADERRDEYARTHNGKTGDI